MELLKANPSRRRTSASPLPNSLCKLQHLYKEVLRCIVRYKVVHNNRDSHPSKAKQWTISVQTNHSYVSLQTVYHPPLSYKRILAFLSRWWLNLSVSCPLAKKSQPLPFQISLLCGVVNVVPMWTHSSSSLIMVHVGFATFADWITKPMAIITHS